MSILINSDTRVIVQGITGSQGKLHAEKMLEYGTKEEIEELHRFYGHEAFARIKDNPKGFMLYDVVLKNLKTVGL